MCLLGVFGKHNSFVTTRLVKFGNQQMQHNRRTRALARLRLAYARKQDYVPGMLFTLSGCIVELYCIIVKNHIVAHDNTRNLPVMNENYLF